MNVSQNTTDPINSQSSSLVGVKSSCSSVPKGKPLDYHMLTPWVKVTFEGGKGFMLTVGNSSYPHADVGLRHSAVIKDFELGMSDGAGCRFTVHDQIGSPFVTFIDRMNKQFNEANNDYTMKIQFGWIARDCGGNVKQIPEKPSEITFLPTSIENSFNDGGKIVYTIEGNDMFHILGQSRCNKSYGEKGREVTLKQAITDMFAQDPSPRITAKFLRMTDDEPKEWDFQGNTTAIYHANNKSKLEAALDWMKPFLTDDGKGIRYTWDTSATNPTIIFWESPFGGKDKIQPRCLRQYTVNGGKESPVVSFSPRARMVYTKIMNKTGGVIGTTGVQGIKSEGSHGKKQHVGAGVQINSTSAVRNSIIYSKGFGSNVAKETMQAETENSRFFFPFSESVSAELVIQGDPSSYFVYTPLWVGKTLSIVVINPYHLLVSEDSSSCPSWLATPMCNPVFTSNMWYIQKINHSIKAGSYLTTITINLPVMGSDIAEDQLSQEEKENPVQN